jgi:hypothetical protein
LQVLGISYNRKKSYRGVLVNNPMYFLQDIIRRGARMIGWEIGDAIENVMWSVGIGCSLLCCAIFSCGAVAYQIMFHR